MFYNKSYRWVVCTVSIMIVVTGCELLGPDRSLVFRTDRDQYAPGEPVAVSVENNLVTPVGLNLCFAYLSLEQQTDEGGWEPTNASGWKSADTACTAVLNAVRPGRSTGDTFFLPEDHEAGTYRFTTMFEISNTSVLANTNSFVIR